MKKIERVYISGLGAVGCAYGSKIYDMDPACLKVIASKERIHRYTEKGITINGKPYSFNYIHPGEQAEPADLILVAVKQHHLLQAIEDMRNFVGKDTIILSLLNGISSEEILGAHFGMDKLLYAYCVGIDAVREETRVYFSNGGKVVFGEKNNQTISSNTAAVKEFFERAHIPYSIPEDMMRSLWWKFMLNVGINQTSAVLKAPYGVFQTIPEARELMESTCREVVRLSVETGINLTDDDIADFIRVLGTLGADGKTSMLQDVEAGRKTEVEIFAGTIIELGKKYGVPTPINDTLYKMIRTLEQSYT